MPFGRVAVVELHFFESHPKPDRLIVPGLDGLVNVLCDGEVFDSDALGDMGRCAAGIVRLACRRGRTDQVGEVWAAV